VEPLLLQVQLVPLHDKLLESVKDILLDESQVTVEFLVVNVPLNLVVETDPLSIDTCTKFL